MSSENPPPQSLPGPLDKNFLSRFRLIGSLPTATELDALGSEAGGGGGGGGTVVNLEFPEALSEMKSPDEPSGFDLDLGVISEPPIAPAQPSEVSGPVDTRGDKRGGNILNRLGQLFKRKQDEPGSLAQSSAPELVPPASKDKQAMIDSVTKNIAGAGGKMREFFRSKAGQNVLAGVKIVTGAAIGFAIADILKLGPGPEAAGAIAAQGMLGLSRLGTEIGAVAIESAEVAFPRFAKLSTQLAGEKGISGVFRSLNKIAARIQSHPVIIGLTLGVVGHSFYEALSGHSSIIHDIQATEPPLSATTTPTETAVPTETAAQTETAVPTGTPAPTEAPAASPTPVPGGDYTPDEGVDNSSLPDGGVDTTTPPGDQLPAEDELPTAPAAEQPPVAETPPAAPEISPGIYEVQPNDNLTTIVQKAGGDPYGADMTNTILQSADTLVSSRNPQQDTARILIEYLKEHPSMTWREAINNPELKVADRSLNEIFSQALGKIFPGQQFNVVVGGGTP